MEKTAWFRKRECRTHQLEYPVRHRRQNPDRPFEQFVHVSSPHAILKTGPTDKKPATSRISTPPQRHAPHIPPAASFLGAVQDFQPPQSVTDKITACRKKPSRYAQQIRRHTPFPTVSKQTNRTRLSRQTIAFQTASAASKLPSQHKTTQATHKCRLKIQTAA